MTIQLDTFINVSISTGSAAIEKVGFGTPGVLAYFPTTIFTDRAKKYSGRTVLDDLVTDGFTVNHPVYKMCAALTAQQNKTEYIVVGRRANAPVQAIDITVENTTNTISVTVEYDGTSETYTRVGTGVPAADATALAATITAGAFGVATNITATGVGPDVQIRQGAGPDTGQIFYFDDLAYCTLDDVTADPGLVADITAIRAADDSWYWGLLDSCGGAEQTLLASTINSLEKVAACQSQDQDNFDNTAGNLLDALKTAGYTRVFVSNSRYSMAEYPACAAVAHAAPLLPGQWTLGWFEPVGVTADDEITAAEWAIIDANYGNVCLSIRNKRPYMPGGRTPAGGWIDLIQLTDWLREEIRTRLADVLIQAAALGRKIAYDDGAGKIAVGEIRAAYKVGAKRGGFVLDDFTAEYLPAASQTASDKTNRIFNGTEFTGTFKSAVVEFTVSGRIAS